MKNLLAVCFLFYSYAALTQAYLKPRVIDYNPGTCNNTFVCEFYNFDFPHRPYSSTNLTSVVSFSDTIYNFCFTPDAANPAAAMEGFSTNGYISHYLLVSSPVTPAYNYNVTSFTPATNSTSQDGTLILQFDSTININNIVVSQESGYTPPAVFTSVNVLEISSLNEDWLSIFLTHPSDTSKFLFTKFYIGDPTDIYVNTGMDVNVSLQHAGNSCTGWINLQANPPGTYYNQWSDGVANTTTRTDLCPGIYGVYSYDLVSGYYNTGHIDTIVITNDSLTYIDTNLYSITPQDTAYYFDVNCTFDFFAPIDSSFYSEDTISFIDPLLIATFELILYQGNNQVIITDTLVTVADSTVLLDVVIYCNLFKSVFKGQRILFVRGADDHFFVSPYLTIPGSENPVADVLVYPNPGNGIYNLSFPNSEMREIKIFSAAGQLILNETTQTNFYQLDLQNEEAAIYFLQIAGQSGTQIIKIIKE
jgi:hypothetical protein